LSPNLSSHDWHVQPICQRPNRLPPERRAFSPERISPCAQAVWRGHSCPRLTSRAPTRNPSVLETLKVTGSGACCQPIVPTGFPPFMHILLGILGSSTVSFLRVASCPLWFVDLPPRTQRCNERRSGFPSCSFVPFVVVDLPPRTQTYTKRDRELFYAQQNAASACEAAPFRHQPKRKSANLIKDLVKVLATNAKTLRGSLSPNETPWPGLISGFTCFLFDAGRATRDSDKTPG
jgi:hypothetical protein